MAEERQMQLKAGENTIVNSLKDDCHYNGLLASVMTTGVCGGLIQVAKIELTFQTPYQIFQ